MRLDLGSLMLFGGHPLQLLVVFLLAVTLTLLGWERRRVAFAGGRISFVIAAGWMLFARSKPWYPPGVSIAATATWVLSGYVLSLSVWELVSRARRPNAGGKSSTQGASHGRN